MTDNAVQVRDLVHRFGNEEVLHGLSFDIPRGSIVGLLGPSGSGKTTLIRCIAGLLRHTSGQVEILDTLQTSAQRAGQIGYMAQADALYGDLNADQNLSFFASLYGIRGKAAKARIGEL